MKKILSFLLIAVFLISLQTSAFAISLNIEVHYDELDQGDSGDVVKNLQLLLRDLGYFTDTVDHVYGHSTADAVFNFQRMNGLPATGVADSVTHEAVYQNEALPAPALPQLRFSELVLDHEGDTIDCTLCNETGEAITDLYYWVICYNLDGQILSGEGTEEESASLPEPQGGLLTMSAGEETLQIPCPFKDQVYKAFAGVCGYRTESGMVMVYAPEQVFFACSDGAVLVPVSLEDPAPAEELQFETTCSYGDLGLKDFAGIP